MEIDCAAEEMYDVVLADEIDGVLDEIVEDGACEEVCNEDSCCVDVEKLLSVVEEVNDDFDSADGAKVDDVKEVEEVLVPIDVLD